MRAAAVLIALTLCLGAGAGAAHADDGFRAKKDRRLDAKAEAPTDPEARRAWQAKLDARIGRQPARVVNIYNYHTKEYLPFSPGADGAIPEELADRFFRCHFTNEPTDMDPQLVALLSEAARKFGAERINIVSGFRSPKYNLVLRKKGREVARDSQHTHGRAVDFRIPGVSVQRLYRWVRSMRLGGVGFYRHSKFIHADTWRVRTWTGK